MLLSTFCFSHDYVFMNKVITWSEWLWLHCDCIPTETLMFITGACTKQFSNSLLFELLFICIFAWKRRGRKSHLFLYSPQTLSTPGAGSDWSQEPGTPSRLLTWWQGPPFLTSSFAFTFSRKLELGLKQEIKFWRSNMQQGHTKLGS